MTTTTKVIPVTSKSFMKYWNRRLEEVITPLNDDIELHVRHVLSVTKAPITGIQMWQDAWQFVAEEFLVQLKDGGRVVIPRKYEAGEPGKHIECWVRSTNITWTPVGFAHDREKLKALCDLLTWWCRATGGRNITL